MPVFILDDATGIGSDDLDSLQAFVDLVIIANDDGIGLNAAASGMQQVTYVPTMSGPPQTRLDTLVNTTFTPDYGAGPAQVDIIIIAGLSGFTMDDGTPVANNGFALPPASSGLPGSSSNPTQNCLVVYDTQQNICLARDGTDGDLTLPASNPVVLYHELSHAFRIVNNAMLALTVECDPASPEENAAILDENDMRTQIANRQGATPELRDPNIHCGQVGCDGGCCIIATVATKSFSSLEVQQLRKVRDHFVRSTEVGFEFFEKFFYDYYSFSPEVCTIMAGNSHISEQMLEGFVNPMLDFWKIIIARSQVKMTSKEIGSIFAQQNKDKVRARSRYDFLCKTRDQWLKPTFDNKELPVELMKLLGERALTSEYMQWAIIAPLEIYFEILSGFLENDDPEKIGQDFNSALESWAPEIPISEVWASLASRQVMKELKICDTILFQTASNEKRFRQRLLEKYSDITSVQKALKEITT